MMVTKTSFIILATNMINRKKVATSLFVLFISSAHLMSCMGKYLKVIKS
jgi:hypothetical protein